MLLGTCLIGIPRINHTGSLLVHLSVLLCSILGIKEVDMAHELDHIMRLRQRSCSRCLVCQGSYWYHTGLTKEYRISLYSETIILSDCCRIPESQSRDDPPPETARANGLLSGYFMCMYPVSYSLEKRRPTSTDGQIQDACICIACVVISWLSGISVQVPEHTSTRPNLSNHTITPRIYDTSTSIMKLSPDCFANQGLNSLCKRDIIAC